MPDDPETAAPPDDSRTSAPLLTEGRGTDEPPGQPFEDLTISEFLAHLLRAPAATLRRYQRAVRSANAREQQIAVRVPAQSESHAASAGSGSDWVALRNAPNRLLQSEYPRLVLYLIAFAFALAGSGFARGSAEITRSEGNALQAAAPYLWLGFLLWLLADVSAHWRQVRTYWRSLDRETRLLWYVRTVPIILAVGSLLRLAQSLSAPRESAVGVALSALLLLAAGLAALTVINAAFRLRQRRGGAVAGDQPENSAQTNVVDRQPIRAGIRHAVGPPADTAGCAGVGAQPCRLVQYRWQTALSRESCWFGWRASYAGHWCLRRLRGNIFDSCVDAIDGARRLRLRGRRSALLALALVLFVGASFRFDRLDSAPPELISDMVVNIADSYRIQRGEIYPIFLGNNGGREPIHIYLQTFMSSLPGLDFDRITLVLATTLESFLTLPVMFFFAVEVMGKHRRGFALAVGILATALLAVSFWHVVLARQGLRIPLSPLFTALSAVFFARALRHNRRSDYILAGITLSCGLYSYKSLRMLPLVYVTCVAIALLLRRYIPGACA